MGDLFGIMAFIFLIFAWDAADKCAEKGGFLVFGHAMDFRCIEGKEIKDSKVQESK